MWFVFVLLIAAASSNSFMTWRNDLSASSQAISSANVFKIAVVSIEVVIKYDFQIASVFHLLRAPVSDISEYLNRAILGVLLSAKHLSSRKLSPENPVQGAVIEFTYQAIISLSGGMSLSII